MMNLRNLIISILVFSFSLFANGIEKISVSVDRHYYRIFVQLAYPEKVVFLKDPKRDLLVLKLNNRSIFKKEFYSVLIKGDKGIITVLVKNPKLDTAKAWVSETGNLLKIFIPIKNGRSSFVVVVDPGHGGKDSGAYYHGFMEKNINIAIAKKLYKLLLKDPRIKPYLTRKGDYFVPLGSRQKFTAKVGADLFISIHANANPKHPNRSGTEFYILSDKGIYRKWIDIALHPEEAEKFFSPYIAKNKKLRSKVAKNTLEITQDEGEDFANILKHYWCEYLGKELHCLGIYKRNFAVLKVPGVPTILIEVGYMTNKHDLKLITNDKVQWKIAKTIYRAILDYFGLKPLN
jgi:N-acetylmuramoyl-L-alanine amidase